MNRKRRLKLEALARSFTDDLCAVHFVIERKNGDKCNHTAEIWESTGWCFISVPGQDANFEIEPLGFKTRERAVAFCAFMGWGCVELGSREVKQ